MADDSRGHSFGRKGKSISYVHDDRMRNHLEIERIALSLRCNSSGHAMTTCQLCGASDYHLTPNLCNLCGREQVEIIALQQAREKAIAHSQRSLLRTLENGPCSSAGLRMALGGKIPTLRLEINGKKRRIAWTTWLREHGYIQRAECQKPRATMRGYALTKRGKQILEEPMTIDEALKVVMPFGKHKGRPLNDVPATYIDWLAGITLIDPLLREAVSVIIADPTFKKELAEQIGEEA